MITKKQIYPCLVPLAFSFVCACAATAESVGAGVVTSSCGLERPQLEKSMLGAKAVLSHSGRDSSKLSATFDQWAQETISISLAGCVENEDHTIHFVEFIYDTAPVWIEKPDGFGKTKGHLLSDKSLTSASVVFWGQEPIEVCESPRVTSVSADRIAEETLQKSETINGTATIIWPELVPLRGDCEYRAVARTEELAQSHTLLKRSITLEVGPG